MKKYTADLHVHSVLSPCGDLSMSPTNIIKQALKRKIDIVGISDHNTTRHCRLMEELGRESGIFVLPGVEINTKEEIHCLAFFENTDNAEKFQIFLDKNLPAIANDPERFGDQVVVDRDEQIIDVVNSLLINALNADIYEVAEEVRRLGGILIPAHIDRSYNSILSQLGFIPGDIEPDALEVSARENLKSFAARHPELQDFTLITNSDAHHPTMLGKATTSFEIEERSFSEIKLALNNKEGRKVIC